MKVISSVRKGFRISDEDTAKTLLEKTTETAGEMLDRVLPQIKKGKGSSLSARLLAELLLRRAASRRWRDRLDARLEGNTQSCASRYSSLPRSFQLRGSPQVLFLASDGDPRRPGSK